MQIFLGQWSSAPKQIGHLAVRTKFRRKRDQISSGSSPDIYEINEVVAEILGFWFDFSEGLISQPEFHCISL
jgi:hypothetical protein